MVHLLERRADVTEVVAMSRPRDTTPIPVDVVRVRIAVDVDDGGVGAVSGRQPQEQNQDVVSGEVATAEIGNVGIVTVDGLELARRLVENSYTLIITTRLDRI